MQNKYCGNVCIYVFYINGSQPFCLKMTRSLRSLITYVNRCEPVNQRVAVNPDPYLQSNCVHTLSSQDIKYSCWLFSDNANKQSKWRSFSRLQKVWTWMVVKQLTHQKTKNHWWIFVKTFCLGISLTGIDILKLRFHCLCTLHAWHHFLLKH